MTDEVTLTLPRHKPFYRIAHLVLGGLAVRLDLTFDSLEDLQLALAGLLEHRADGDGEVMVSLRVDGDRFYALVGPFAATVRAELAREGGADVGLARLLETVVDSVGLAERDGAHWVELTKHVRADAR